MSENTLVETPTWTPGIYQIETDDPVVGGPDGISNRQARELASRTAYLKQQLESSTSALALHAASNDHPLATTAAKGMVILATVAEALAGVANNRAVTPEGMAAAIAALVNSSPAALDTLNELAAALGNDPNFAATITTALGQAKGKIRHLVEAAGLTWSDTDSDQLTLAIVAMIAANATNTIPVAAKAAAYTAVAEDRAKLLDCTGTFSLSFTAVATLGNGWWCAVRNSGTGTITLDPNGAELIDGAATALLAPGASCIVVCSGAALSTLGKTATQAGYANRQIFTNTGTFTVPAGVTRVFVEVWGGGGGGGDVSVIQSSPGGGGGGYTNKLITGLMPGSTVSVTVGAAGTPGAGASGGSIGGTGGTSSFGAHCSATGGVGGDGRGISGASYTWGNPGGAGGSGTGGDLNLTGAPGQMAMDGAHGDTSGAGGAGARGAGGGAGVRTKGDVALGGIGGGTPGGGGSGGIAYGGGWGGAGMVIVWW